jgi:hypothetical protein
MDFPSSLLDDTLRAAFGSACRLEGAQRLGGGTRKQAFRLDLGHPHMCTALLVWHNEHDYFNEQIDPTGWLSDAVAPQLYAANTRLLLENGVRVPRIFHFDGSCLRVPYAFALVEWVQGQSFREYAGRSARVQPTLEKMKAYLQRLHAIRRGHWGTVLEDTPHAGDYPEDALKGSLPDLEGLARVHAGVGRCEQAVRESLLSMRSRLVKRAVYPFIHNELGPDEHVVILEDGEITMLDIDGCHFADLEREHAYLRLRFGEHYPALSRPDLEPLRMDFYQLCLHISSAYGHYQLLEQGFPGPESLRSIFERNARLVVESVG